MNRFRYQAVGGNGTSVKGVIEAEDRKSALDRLGERGLYPSSLQPCATKTAGNGNHKQIEETATAPGTSPATAHSRRWGSGIRRKEVTSLTREMASLLEAGIPIPQALASIAQEESNLAVRTLVQEVSESVRKGAAISTALEEWPHVFSKLYVSMVRVGEEAGALPAVLADLADLLEHEDEVRGDVRSAVAYPLFVLGFGIVTVVILLTFVLPRVFSMLEESMDILPLPTLMLLRLSEFFHGNWPWLLAGTGAITAAIFWHLQSPKGAFGWDRLKLNIPLIGPVFRSAALSRFARTLGTLARSGVSLLPALKIVENTIGNLFLGSLIAQVAEETRGGDSLATPLRKLGVFPSTLVQMIGVGEESGKLDEMLLRVAAVEERHMRTRTKTLVSLLAPILILVVGMIVGFIVLALLLAIFKMSRAMH